VVGDPGSPQLLATQEKLDLVHCLFGRHFIRERLPLRKNPVSHTILTVDPIVKFVTFLTSLAFSGTSGGGHVFAKADSPFVFTPCKSKAFKITAQRTSMATELCFTVLNKTLFLLLKEDTRKNVKLVKSLGALHQQIQFNLAGVKD